VPGGAAAAVVVLVVVEVARRGLVWCAETLRDHRGRLIAEAAAFNARMTAQNQPHAWIVPPPSRVERAVYAVADRCSVRRSRRAGQAAAVRVALGGDR